MENKPNTPAGVTASAIVLALLSLLAAGVGVIFAFGAAAIQKNPSLAVSTPGAAPVTPQAVMVTCIVFMLTALLIAGWGLATVVGLFGLKSWARVSVMVVGGCVVALALLGVLVAALMGVGMNSVPTPGLTPAAVRSIVAAVGSFWIVIGAIGVWWLVYFAQRSTGAAFTQARLAEQAAKAARLQPPPGS